MGTTCSAGKGAKRVSPRLRLMGAMGWVVATRGSAGAQKRRRNGMQGAMHLNNFIFSLAVWIPDLLLTYKSLEQ